MFANALVLSTCFILALLFFLMGELKYLSPLRDLIGRQYGWQVGIYFLALFVNLYAAFYFLMRKLLLKDAGKKLGQVDKQLRVENARFAQIYDDEVN